MTCRQRRIGRLGVANLHFAEGEAAEVDTAYSKLAVEFLARADRLGDSTCDRLPEQPDDCDNSDQCGQNEAN